jgi:hypothetical protein
MVGNILRFGYYHIWKEVKMNVHRLQRKSGADRWVTREMMMTRVYGI